MAVPAEASGVMMPKFICCVWVAVIACSMITDALPVAVMANPVLVHRISAPVRIKIFFIIIPLVFQ